MENPTSVAVKEEENPTSVAVKEEENGGALAPSLNYNASPFPFPGGNLTRIKQHYCNGSSASTSSSSCFTKTLKNSILTNRIQEPKFHISPSYPGCFFTVNSSNSTNQFMPLPSVNCINGYGIAEPMFVNPVSNSLNYGFRTSWECVDCVRIIDKATCKVCSQDLLILWSNDPTFTDEIFKGVIDFIFPLMSHQHGHALFEMLVQFCAKDHRLRLIAGRAVSEVLRRTTLNGFCLKSIGKLIKALGDSDFIEDVMKIFSSNFFRMMISPTGSHLILKSIDLLSPSKNELLYEAAEKNALDLAIHEKGCLNLKSFISSSRGPGRGQLLQVITESSVFLSQDPFGNFVVQHVLELESPTFTKEICARLKGHFVKISMQKAGSHVVEKCLMSRGMELVVQDFIDSNQLQHVIKDQYGNYVIQTALKVTMVAKSPLFDKLVSRLLQHRNVMMKGHGRSVQKCLNLAGVQC